MTTSIYDTSYIIYKHTNTVTGKSYIGKTVDGIDKRWNNHISCSKNPKKRIRNHFMRSLYNYGTDCWTHEILYISFEQDDHHLYEVEEQLISDWDTFHNGYNSTVGGSGIGSGINCVNFGRTYTKEQIERISISHKGDKNGMYGKNHSNETKNKISMIKTELYKTSKHPMSGKTHSTSTKMKMSTSASNRIVTDKTRVIMSKGARRGKEHHNYSGCYKTPIGYFYSMVDTMKKLNTSKKTIMKWCRTENDKVISNIIFSLSKFLQSIGTREEIVGKTFKELGFGFKPKL